jgi:hypothetical protein
VLAGLCWALEEQGGTTHGKQRCIGCMMMVVMRLGVSGRLVEEKKKGT